MSFDLNKNKNTVYILLPCVIFIWGIIFYRIIGNQPSDQSFIESNNDTVIPSIENSDSTIHFDLNLNYKDPFLGTITEPNNNTPTIENVNNNSSPQAKDEIRWPEIIYQGCVKNETGKLAYITINERVYLAGIEELSPDISILDINNDSIQMGFKNEKRWYKK